MSGLKAIAVALGLFCKGAGDHTAHNLTSSFGYMKKSCSAGLSGTVPKPDLKAADEDDTKLFYSVKIYEHTWLGVKKKLRKKTECYNFWASRLFSP
ncbi:MAG: hypothetical protein IKP60_10285 [Treponema sp.]|nr:hypothetical protein [Treponema sp.]